MENSDDTVRRKLVAKFNNYFRHWQDLNMLVALFAMVGLILSVIAWETQFSNRGPTGSDSSSVGFFVNFVVLVISIMGAVAIVIKYYFEAVWQQYKNPVAFYKSMILRQVELGNVNEDTLTENFQIQSPFSWIVRQTNFWLELILMLVVPMPSGYTEGTFTDKVVYIEAINWIDNGGVNSAQSFKYNTPYFMTDFFLAFMFLRFYFFTLAVIMFSPVNERLYGKRVC